MDDLGDVERELVQRFIDRLRFGQREYGRFRPSSDSRNYAVEAVEEALDGFVYSAVNSMRASRIRNAALDEAASIVRSVAKAQECLDEVIDSGRYRAVQNVLERAAAKIEGARDE